MGRLLPAAFEAASVRYRRILPVPVGAGERPFTEPTAAVRRRQRDRRATVRRQLLSRFFRYAQEAEYPHCRSRCRRKRMVECSAAPQWP